MKVRELKEALAQLPEGFDEQDVLFGATTLEGLYEVDGLSKAKFDENDVPEEFTKEFLLLWCPACESTIRDFVGNEN